MHPAHRFIRLWIGIEYYWNFNLSCRSETEHIHCCSPRPTSEELGSSLVRIKTPLRRAVSFATSAKSWRRRVSDSIASGMPCSMVIYLGKYSQQLKTPAMQQPHHIYHITTHLYLHTHETAVNMKLYFNSARRDLYEAIHLISSAK